MTSGVEHIPNDSMRQTVEDLTAFGHTQEEIAAHLKMSVETLSKYYRNELDTAVINANSKVAKGLFKKAVDDEDLGAQIFWLKTRGKGKWVEQKQADTKDTIIEQLLQLNQKNSEK